MDANVQNAVEEVKAGAEVALEAFVEKAYAPVVEGLLVEVKKSIPGQIDDVVIDMLAEKLKPMAKQLLLEQIEKISDKV